MSATPAYKRLAQFHPSGQRQPAAAVQASSPTWEKPSPARDAQSDLAAAHDAGVKAGRLAAEQEFAHKQELIEAVHAEEMRHVVDERLVTLARNFETELANLRGTLADSIAAMMRPLVARIVGAEILDAVRAELDAAIESAVAPTIVVQGPAALLDRLKAEFEARGHAVRFEETAGVEVRLIVDRTLVETRIGDWMKLLETAL